MGVAATLPEFSEWTLLSFFARLRCSKRWFSKSFEGQANLKADFLSSQKPLAASYSWRLWHGSRVVILKIEKSQ